MLVLSVIDVLTQEVYDSHLIVIAIMVLLLLITGKAAVAQHIPGVILWILFSLVLGERMGDGDKILIGILLLVFPPLLQIRFLLYAIWSAAIYAVILLLKGASRKTKIPFVPFIASGFFLVLVLHGGML